MTQTIELLSGILFGIGGVFCLLAALGIVVMPDVYTRMQAASKAVTFGALAILLASLLGRPDTDLWVRGLLICAFLVITIPVGSHLLGRAAYRVREPLAPETVIDELGCHGDESTDKTDQAGYRPDPDTPGP